MENQIKHDQTEVKSYQCRHIFTDGHRCGSKCLRHEEFCYYHHTSRRPIADVKGRIARETQFDLPLAEDRSAIQACIGEVIRRIARNEIDPKRAGLLLYGLQTASINLPREPAPTRKDVSERDALSVEEIILDDALGALAPRAEFNPEKDSKRPSLASVLMEHLSRTHGIRPLETDPEDEETAEETAILPEIQAVADAPNRIPKQPFAPRSRTVGCAGWRKRGRMQPTSQKRGVGHGNR